MLPRAFKTRIYRCTTETWKFTNKVIVSVYIFTCCPSPQSEYGLTEEQVAGESPSLIEISPSGWIVDKSIRVCQSVYEGFKIKWNVPMATGRGWKVQKTVNIDFNQENYMKAHFNHVPTLRENIEIDVATHPWKRFWQQLGNEAKRDMKCNAQYVNRLQWDVIRASVSRLQFMPWFSPLSRPSFEQTGARRRCYQGLRIHELSFAWHTFSAYFRLHVGEVEGKMQ